MPVSDQTMKTEILQRTELRLSGGELNENEGASDYQSGSDISGNKGENYGQGGGVGSQGRSTVFRQ